MSLDLGFETYKFYDSKNNESKIEQFIKQLEEQFDFVLICEYFDESMVLLRRYLRWSMKDIIYLRVNAAPSLPSSSPFLRKPNITPEVKESFKQWDRIDYDVYEYFLTKFLNKLKSEPHFTEELGTFKVIESEVENFCSKDNRNKIVEIPASNWTNEFTVTKQECKVMMTPELSLVDTVRRMQLRRYNNHRRLLASLRDSSNKSSSRNVSISSKQLKN